MPAIVVRTIILYLLVVFSLRFMGKKQIGQLEPAELAIAIMISELASIPLSSRDIPLMNGVVPVLVLVCCEVFISWLTLKNVKIRKFVSGQPSLLIENGKLMPETFRNIRFTTDDLMEEMRQNGITSIQDIQYAIMETNGKMSFILKKSASPPTIEDLKLSIPEEQMPFPILVKGEIYQDNLMRIKKNEQWLSKELEKRHIKDRKEVLLLCANHEKITFLQLREHS